MYLRGLRSLGDDYTVDPTTGDVIPSYSDPLAVAIDNSVAPPIALPAPPPDVPSLPSSTPPTATTPWTTLAQGALNVWSKISSAQNAQGATVARVAYPAQGSPLARAGYSPFPATGGFSLNPSGAGGILMPLAIGAAAFFLIMGFSR